MLTYRCIDTLGVVGFSDFDYSCYVDDKNSTSGYIFMMAERVVVCLFLYRLKPLKLT